MKKVFKIEDLDCGHCAQLIEDGIRKIDGVRSVNLNFLAQKLSIEADDEIFDEVVKKAVKAAARIEPDASIVL